MKQLKKKEKMDPDFEQDYHSLTAKTIYRIGRDSIRITKWLASYGQNYETINYFDLMASVLSYLKE